MPLNIFEFQKQFMTGAFLIKLTQFEKTGSINELLIPVVSLKIHSLSKLEVEHVFHDFNKFINGNKLNFKRNHFTLQHVLTMEMN